MDQLYFEYKQILDDLLVTLGFTAQPENSAGPGRSITYKKDDFQVQWVFDLRDQMLTLQAQKDKKLAGRAHFYSSDKLQSDFLQKLDEILSAQGFDTSALSAAFAARQASSKPKKGFLAKLFGGKSS